MPRGWRFLERPIVPVAQKIASAFLLNAGLFKREVWIFLSELIAFQFAKARPVLGRHIVLVQGVVNNEIVRKFLQRPTACKMANDLLTCFNHCLNVKTTGKLFSLQNCLTPCLTILSTSSGSSMTSHQRMVCQTVSLSVGFPK